MEKIKIMQIYKVFTVLRKKFLIKTVDIYKWFYLPICLVCDLVYLQVNDQFSYHIYGFWVLKNNMVKVK